jgi:hypothetical protein
MNIEYSIIVFHRILDLTTGCIFILPPFFKITIRTIQKAPAFLKAGALYINHVLLKYILFSREWQSDNSHQHLEQ